MLCGRSVQELWEMQRKLCEEGAGHGRGFMGPHKHAGGMVLNLGDRTERQ